MKAEAVPDLDALMATVADAARDRAWGTDDPLYGPEGKEAVRSFEARMAVFWPMDDEGLVLGEETYTAGDGFADIAGRKLARADLELA